MDLIENTTCIGRVTHVSSPDSVWIQICRGVTGTDYLTQLGTLTDNITDTLGRLVTTLIIRTDCVNISFYYSNSQYR